MPIVLWERPRGVQGLCEVIELRVAVRSPIPPWPELESAALGKKALSSERKVGRTTLSRPPILPLPMTKPSSPAPWPRHPDANTSNRRSDTGKKTEKTDQERDPMTVTTASDLGEHLVKLREISTAASHLFVLIGEHVTSVSNSLPIQKGHQTVAELKARAKTHCDGLKSSFKELRDLLEQVKTGFWDKHGEILEAKAYKYIGEKLRERIPVEVKKQLEPYTSYLENNEAFKKEIKKSIDLSHTRLQNSLLRIKYPAEPVAWIGDLPDGTGPTITLQDLINADDSLMLNLAQSLGLSPVEGEDHIDVFNRLLRQLGLTYKALPSYTGALLMPMRVNA